MDSRRVVPCLAALAAVAGVAWAQTPEQQRQMEYERQQREYWRAQEQQRQEQQRQQQIMNENARRQQDESRRLNQPTGSSGSGGSGPGASGVPAGGERQRIEAELDRQRAEWSKRPALPPERNPLLGRWMRPAETRGNANDPFAQLAALSKGGMCELFFGGGGTFEFKPGALVGSDAHTRPKELDQVEYRGDDKRVIVIPKSTFKLIDFRFDGPDRITWPLYNCTLVRVTGATAAGSGATPAAGGGTASRASGGGAGPAGAPAAASAAASSSARAQGTVMALAVSTGAEGATRPRSTPFFVLRHSADVALRQGGFQPRAGLAVVPSWILECQQKTPACKQGAVGLTADAVGSLRTDAQGHALTDQLPPGTYYLFGSVVEGGQERFWNVRVDLKPGTNDVKLDQRNLAAP